MSGTTRQPDARPGLALVAVLVVMGGAILVATSLLFVAQAEVAGAARADARARTRALARSGLRAVMLRLDEQRDVILEGASPEIDEQLEIYEAGARLGVVRLLPAGPAGTRLVPEAGKLDLEAADAERLAATGLVDEVVGRSIREHRDLELRRPYQSVGELLGVPGLRAEEVYGPIEDLAEPRPGDFETPGEPAPRGLADVVTVYGFEPALQMSGALRINLNVPWSETLGERVAGRFGEEAAQTLQRIMESGTRFDTDAKIFQVLNFFEVPASDWPEIVDAFTTDSGDLHFGRLDINTAPREALMTLPGIGPEQATQLVQVRDDLDADERATIAWPATRGILETGAYEQLGGLITTRSWTYRVRLAAGEVEADDPEAPLRDAVVYEAVIDLAAPRPRLAYLREVTWLPVSAAVALTAMDEDEAAEGPEAATPQGGGPGDSAGPGSDASTESMESGDPAPVSTPRTRIGRWTSG